MIAAQHERHAALVEGPLHLARHDGDRVRDEREELRLALPWRLRLRRRDRNVAAIAVYRSLGYSVKAEFEERLVIRRSGLSMPRLLRRLLGR